MSLKAETLLEVLKMTTAVAMATETETEMPTVIVHPKTTNQDTSQELVTVGTGLRLNQLATTMRNSLSA
jgi:hypothetical protein